MKQVIKQGCSVDNILSIEQELKEKFNKETAKLDWPELQRYFASGAVVRVANNQDLIEVAIQFSVDNKEKVAQWLETGAVFKVDDELALQWQQHQPQVWAVVVAPWVLVQEVS